MNSKSIYQQMKDAEVEIDSHESDLYVPINKTTEGIVCGYAFCSNVTRFRNQINNQMWFDIPFAYEPFYEKKAKTK